MELVGLWTLQGAWHEVQPSSWCDNASRTTLSCLEDNPVYEISRDVNNYVSMGETNATYLGIWDY